MNGSPRFVASALLGAMLLAAGCAAPKVDFTQIERPTRPGDLDAYNAFVGNWTWEAELVNAEGEDKNWSGTASWMWTLDDHWLHGRMSSKSANAEFEAAGVWGWNPQKKQYVWWMFNNWGYPQEGTAIHDESAETWTMNYTAIGLDGTTSYGRYELDIVDNNTINWNSTEWADVLHTVKKLDMKGTYKRQ